MSSGLLSYASYLPRYRLSGQDIGVRHGNRVVASYDEDSTTMAVAAASSALMHSAVSPRALYFATSSPAYADKTNATAIHAALGLPADMPAADMCGTARSAFAALTLAASSGGLVVAADVRVGRPGSADEKLGGDGAAALIFGEGDVIAEYLASRSLTAEFLDRWRDPTSRTGQQWEERFGAQHYTALIRDAAREALDAAGIADPDHVVVACPNSGVVKRAATLVKGQKTVATSVGFGGSADALIALCGTLDVAEAGDTILVLSATDGCDAMVLRATSRLPRARQPWPLNDQRAEGTPVEYVTYLAWRGLVTMEPPRRPEPERPAAPPASRARLWKFGMTGARCRACGFMHLPPVRVCRSCNAIDEMDPQSAAGLRGTVVTYTVDRLAYSPSPPMVQAVVDVDGGGRCTLEVADARVEDLRVGTRVRFSFRRLFTASDVHNYFWKVVQDDAE
ncbi:OB-fold domain-containing protein [Mycobacterium avium]|uniref:OB-fold domain-containing protein n=1 Tax=Mycobacterium avium TaxID=1764 RepID=UPI0004236AE4|nr:OB-fold domain-containing protein [Mycobacterium avium]